MKDEIEMREGRRRKKGQLKEITKGEKYPEEKRRREREWMCKKK